ncbi:DUF2339 domain-containing protein [Natrarchaeobius oligotrophus]|uniref:DUF2339 domain-containing protein n=1 Tax=Natrarchaeobius chitinivorans TaxID=1679083 RepID=A0A3N6PJT5_NATCH|nr:DUF2339 domain-containing protein [Natrarchaeobius chitinivorans]RQH01430.1 DUF2339 domain-containing protein [Natrarchaeobius chitinivorans]
MNDEDLQREVERLRTEVDALHRRLETIEERLTEDDSVPADEPTEGASATDGIDADAEPSPTDEAGAAESQEPPEASAADRDLESVLGVRWLGLVGALALVVGAVFFVRLAIEIGLLGPAGRVAVGALAGLALFGGGRYAAVRRGRVRWGRIAAGAGLAIAYFSTYAAYGFESYREAIGTPLWAVLLALTLLVTVTAGASIRDGAPLVAGEAFLLGYVTATLSTDAATVAVTPVYVLLLAGGIAAIATIRPWSRLVVSSAFATYGVLFLWLVDLEPSAVAIGGAGAAAFATYLVGGYVLRAAASTGESDATFDRSFRTQAAVLTVANAGFATLFLEIAIRSAVATSAVEGLGAVAVAAALAGTYLLTDRRPIRRDGPAGASAVAFLAAGIVLAAGTFAATVGTLAVVCAAVTLARIGATPALEVGAHVVAGALVVKLLAVDATDLPAFDAADPAATLTGRPVAFALAVATFYGLAWWFSRADPAADVRGKEATVPAGYAAAATGLGVLILGLELSGVGISIAWVLFGLALLGIGLGGGVRGLRLLGVGVLALATAKVFLFDTRDLEAVARTASFLVLGVALLVASYCYARLRTGSSEGLGLSDRIDR